MTLLEAKKEEKDTVFQQMREVSRAETESTRHLLIDKQETVRMENAPFRLKMGYLLISVLFILSALIIGLPAFKHLYYKIVSK